MPNRSGVLKAEELLAQPDFLKVPDEIPKLNRAPDGSFQFASQIPTAASRNDTVHGRLFLCGELWATRPLVILVHGWNAELHYLYIMPGIARALNRKGLNVALIELPYHLQRRPHEKNGMRDFISDDLPGMLLATRQAISDIHSLGRWAQAQGCKNVGVWGFSLGAWLAGLYLCQNALPAAAVLTTPISNLARGIEELSFCHPIRSSCSGSEIDLRPLNLTQHQPLIPPAAIQLVESSYDLFVPSETYAHLAATWNLPGWEKQPQGHISVLTSRKAMKQSIDWLATHL